MAEKKTSKLDGLNLHDLLDYERATKLFMERYAFVGQSMSKPTIEEIEKYKFYSGIYAKIMKRIEEIVSNLNNE